MVTYCETKMITTCSPMIGLFFDTMQHQVTKCGNNDPSNLSHLNQCRWVLSNFYVFWSHKATAQTGVTSARALDYNCFYLKPLFVYFDNFLIRVVPGEPAIVNVTSKTSSLEVTWAPPTEPNGIITTFRLCWMLSAQNTTCVTLNGGTTRHEIRNLGKC